MKQVIHKLKTLQPFYSEVKMGLKTFELRKNDRNYKVGDIAFLQEYDMANDSLSGRAILIEITYILENIVGLDENFCIFSFKIL
jgi:ParB family chromosome partitioning protein